MNLNLIEKTKEKVPEKKVEVFSRKLQGTMPIGLVRPEHGDAALSGRISYGGINEFSNWMHQGWNNDKD